MYFERSKTACFISQFYYKHQMRYKGKQCVFRRAMTNEFCLEGGMTKNRSFGNLTGRQKISNLANSRLERRRIRFQIPNGLL